MAAHNIEAIPINSSTVLSINMSHVSKLTSSNYLAWSLQVRSFLNGYGLAAHLTEYAIIPSPTLVVNDFATPNDAYVRWSRQDNLIYSALLGTISTPLQPLVSRCTSTAQIWSTLNNTYAKPSRGHVKQLKNKLKNVSKGAQKFDEYVQGITVKLDQLALLEKPIEHEDAVKIILDGLPDEYKSVVNQIEGKDIAPSIAEVHERLLNHEAKLLHSNTSVINLPITANNAQRNSYSRNYNGNQQQSRNNSNSKRNDQGSNGQWWSEYSQNNGSNNNWSSGYGNTEHIESLLPSIL